MISLRQAGRKPRLLAVGAVVVVLIAGLVALPTVSGAESNRRHRAVSVTLRDFYIRAPQRMPAGNVVLRVANGGPDDHELIVVRKGDSELPLRDDGLTVDEEALANRTAGGLEAGSSGSVRRVRLHLRPGRYELFCNMSGHYLGGMKADVVVGR